MHTAELSPVVQRTLSVVRRRLRTQQSVARLVRSARAVLHFGPWRRVARAVVRWSRPPRLHDTASELLPALDVARVAASLRTDGVFQAGQLPHQVIGRLQEATVLLRPSEYGAFHEGNEDIAALVRDPAVLAVARAYLGAEPELLECNLVVQEASAASARTSVRALGSLSQRRFHFDYAGWHSLNLFVYLTDVDDASGAHEIAVGTHRGKSFRDAVRPSLDDSEALDRFGHCIRAITGPAGTMFFEDTEAFHRRAETTRRRVLLNILFASHRGLFSRGRLVRPYVEHIARGATGGARSSRGT